MLRILSNKDPGEIVKLISNHSLEVSIPTLNNTKVNFDISSKDTSQGELTIFMKFENPSIISS